MANSDTFDRHDGSLQNYSVGPISSLLTPRRHYDIRTFDNASIIIPWTMLQMELYNADHFESYTMLQLETGEAATGTTENWTNATSIGPDASYRYSSTIRRSVTVGTPQTVTSVFTDDISTDFSDAQYIELVLRDFPAQAAGVRLNLSASFIDFTSSPTYAAGQTDSVPFSASLTSLNAGGNLTFRINRTSLVNSTLTNIIGIRFRLTAAGAGTMTFIASAMRLIPQAGYTFQTVDVDTKHETLSRSVPQAGGTEPSTFPGIIYFNDVRPIDNVFWIKFHNGINPVGNDNRLTLAFRYSDIDADSWRVTLTSRSTQSRIAIGHWDGTSETNFFTTPINTNILTQNKDYYLRVELNDDKLNAGIYNAVGGMIGTLLYQTGNITLTEDIRQGYIGYSVEPYHYDFYVYFVGNTYSEYGSFESTVFESNRYVKGATLWEYSSKNLELFDTDTFANIGDVQLFETIGGVYSITRSGSQWFGGIKTGTSEIIGDGRFAHISGEIIATGIPRGIYRILLRDEYGQVVWMNKISPVVRNQWRTFSFNVAKELVPDKYTVQIHQAGFYPDSFKVRNLQVNVSTVAWYASNDGGTNYYPFLNSINDEFSALHFAQAGTQLRVKAFLTNADGWIQGYKLKPHYFTSGHELSA